MLMLPWQLTWKTTLYNHSLCWQTRATPSKLVQLPLLLLLSRVYRLCSHITTPILVPDATKVVKRQARKDIVSYSWKTPTDTFLLFRYTAHTDIPRARSYATIWLSSFPVLGKGLPVRYTPLPARSGAMAGEHERPGVAVSLEGGCLWIWRCHVFGLPTGDSSWAAEQCAGHAGWFCSGLPSPHLHY